MTRRPGEVVVRRDRRADVVVLSGEIDVATARTLGDAVRRATPGAVALVVDLTEVTYFDSGGVRLLDELARDAAARGAALRLVAPERSAARFTLDLTQFPGGALAESVAAALASLPPDGRRPYPT